MENQQRGIADSRASVGKSGRCRTDFLVSHRKVGSAADLPEAFELQIRFVDFEFFVVQIPTLSCSSLGQNQLSSPSQSQAIDLAAMPNQDFRVSRKDILRSDDSHVNLRIFFS